MVIINLFKSNFTTSVDVQANPTGEQISDIKNVGIMLYYVLYDVNTTHA